MRWSYKTVRFGLKKEGLLGSAFLDESEIEFSLNEFGKSGWELVSFMEVQDGLIGVFKQPLNQGLAPLEGDFSEEEPVEAIQPSKVLPTISTSVPVSPEDERDGRDQVPKNDPEQDDGESDDTDVGSIRIE